MMNKMFLNMRFKNETFWPLYFTFKKEDQKYSGVSSQRIVGKYKKSADVFPTILWDDAPLCISSFLKVIK